MKISAQTVAYSISPQGHKIWSGLLTFPRHILAELNTHRMLSKNSASSRAIPSSKMISSILNDTFIPVAWQKEHKGMQGSQYITDKRIINIRKNTWLKQRNSSIATVKALMEPIMQVKEGKKLHTVKDNLVANWNNETDEKKRKELEVMINSIGNDDKDSIVEEELVIAKDGEPISKQIANRLLEPFMYHTVLITGTEWENFFELRLPVYEIDLDKLDELKNMNGLKLIINTNLKN